jgi:hypothetical protein
VDRFMMLQKVGIPSNGMMGFKEIDISLSMKVSHHTELLATADWAFERKVAEVLGDLVGEGIDVYKLSLADIHFLFFQVRVNSISPDLSFGWNCSRMVEDKTGNMAECSHKNTSTFQISSLGVKSIPDKYEYKKYEQEIEGEVVKVYARMLTAIEEFDLIEEFLAKGISLEKIFEDKKLMVEFIYRRLAASLVIEGARYSSISVDEKVELMGESFSINVANKLRDDMAFLSDIGVDISGVKVNCSKCGGEAVLPLPFRSEFLLS